MQKPVRKLGLLAASVMLVPSAFAVEIEEIIVSAQKREQSVQEIPLAIDVFTGDKLASSGVQDLDDLTQVSSSFNINSAGGNGQPFIRGIGSNVLGNGTYGSVSTYIDGAYVPRGYSLVAAAGSLSGLESLQVLKGPQGSLYGRNATGGALVITTMTPSPAEELSGSIEGTLGDYGVKRYRGTVYGGNGDNLAALLSAEGHESDGYIDGLGGTHKGDFDDEDGFSVRGKLVFEPSDKVELVLSGSYAEDEQSTLGFQQVGQFDNTNLAPGLNGPQVVYYGALSGILGSLGLPADQAAAIAYPAAANVRFSEKHGGAFDNQVSAFKNGVIDGKDISDDETGGGYYEDLFMTFKATVDFETFNLVATSAFNDHFDETSGEVFRADPSTTFDFTTINPALAFLNPPNLGFTGVFDTEAFSQEVYLVSTDSDIEWIGGLYYFEEEGTSLLTGDAFGTSAFVADNSFKNESIAGFAEVTWPLSEHWKLTTGLRYTEEKNELSDKIVPGNPLNQPGLVNVGDLDQKDNASTYNLKLSYNAEDWMVYLGASSGFKSGALNTNNPLAGAVGPEEIDALEVGFKSDLADGRIRINGAAFYYQYDNIQLNVLEVSSGANYLVDGVEAEIMGLELDVQAGVTENLLLFAATTLLDTEYTTDATVTPLVGSPSTQLIDGNKMSMSPDAVVIAGFEYLMPLEDIGEVSLNVNVNHNSGFWIDQSNTYGSGGDEDDAFTTANASLNYLSPGETYNVSLWINNLTDEEYFRSGVDAAGGLLQQVTAGRPRSFGITVGAKF